MKYLSVKQVSERLGISIPCVWNWSGNGPYSVPDFPKPYKLGPHMVRWRIDEIQAWEESREKVK
ncbi:transcriptional regulator, AlpA family [Paracoccus chinensis]|uniref:Transcriptional regulator, AlpA family n=2 Tax=Paracoccus chinensis TaxID=525640 RepID=A0A1G9LWV1_9RHOB|nr:transcriptional regulator, AlpA family [Paracoccus chinensis]